MRHLISWLAVALAPFLFCACSESSTDAPSGLPSTVRNLAVLHTLDCNEGYADSVVKVEDGHLKFVCDGEKWVSLQKSTESSSSSESDDNSSERQYSSSSTEGYYSSATTQSSSSRDEQYSSGEDWFYSSDARFSSSSISSSSISAYTRSPDTTEKPPFESHLVTWDEPFYGSEFDETTGILTDLRDNNQYRTMTVGDYTWTLDNLRFSDSTMTPSLKGRFHCDSVSKECRYTWGAAMDSVNTGCGNENVCDGARHWKGICPYGWHIPTERDLSDLLNALPRGSAYETLVNEYEFWGPSPDTSSTVISGIWFATSTNGCKYAKHLSLQRAKNNREYESYHYWLSETYKSVRIDIRCVKD
ncbi:MAG: hypothetical protein IK114_11880 [Fibrobacter sp.]|nr:hypothetical protein [Fibrobacter sp.]